ncbi:MAG: S8 family serine peptidase [Candidatus Cloacimonetes bacterium]|nr:S8 family serine peptidase [Candidatus Cloacimonadota bacterium]
MKKINLVLSFILLSSVLFVSELNSIITEQLKSKIEEETKDSFIRINISLNERYDSSKLFLSTIDLTKDEKRQFVVDELKNFSNLTQNDVLSKLKEFEKNNSIKKINPLWITNVINCYATPSAIKELSNHRDIKSIDFDEMQNMLLDDKNEHKKVSLETLNNREITWNVTKVNADDVWSLGYTGNGVLVAVIDSGVRYTHTDLSDHVWDGGATYPNHGWDFVNNDDDPMDDHSHGTHCAGTVAGDGTSGSQTGMAPDATIMCLKVLDSEGSGSESGVWSAIQFCVDNNVDVMSMSIGWQHAWGVDRESWRDAMINALSAGVVAAVASGNEYDDIADYPIPDNVRTPGDCPPPWLHPDQTELGGISSVVCVGAVDSNDDIAYFSSRGPVTWESVTNYNDYNYNPEIGLIRPDISAPGMNIKSLDYQSNTGYLDGWNGTSMATPCVAGVMALMIQKNLTLTPAQIDQYLEENVDIPQSPKNNTFGSGRVNALATVNAVSASGNPLCNITNPSNGDNILQGSSVNITVDASDPSRSVSYVEFYIDDVYKTTDYSDSYEYLWDTTLYSTGDRIIKAIAFDNESNQTEDEITINLYDPQNLPFSENFTDSSEWSQQSVGCTDRWTSNNSSEAGGSSPEMRAAWESNDPAISRLISPILNTNGLTTLDLSFKHYYDYWGSGITIKIQSSTDKINWSDESWIQVNPIDNIGPETVTTSIINNLGSATYIAWVLDGNLYQFDYWYIDDVLVESVYPQFSLYPNSLNYGDVEVNSTYTLNFTLSNNGGGSLEGNISTPVGYTVSQISRTNNIIKKSHRNLISYSISSGYNAQFSLAFTPTDDINYDGIVSITSNDPDHLSNQLLVYGNGVSSVISVNPASITKSVQLESTVSDNLTIGNSGDYELNYTASIQYRGANRDLITVYPLSIDYWTGTTTSSSKTDVSEARGYNIEDGWMMFDTSAIPDGSTINSIEFNGYVNYTYYPYWNINPISLNPLTASPLDLHTDIGAENSTGYYLRQSEQSDYPTGWKTHILGDSANTDLGTSLIQDWFALGISSRDNDTTYYINFDGWNEANIPYLVIDYTPSATWLTLDGGNSVNNTIAVNGEDDNILVGFDSSGMELGTYNANVIITSNDHDNPSISIPVTMIVENAPPDISLNPLSLDYGALDVLDYVSQQFTITNNGGLDLIGIISTIESYWVMEPTRNSSREIFNRQNTMDFTIPVGQNHTYDLFFWPETFGDFNGNISITSNDPNNPEIFLSVTGKGEANDIEVSPSSLDYGNLNVYDYVEQLITINNYGNIPLIGQITTIEGYWVLEPVRDSKEFNSSRQNSLDFIVNAEQTNIYRLIFFPEYYGNFSGNISITSDDVNDPEIFISVTGTGEANDIEVSPLSLDYSDLNVYDYVEQLITINNHGNIPLIGQITTIEGYWILEPVRDSKEFYPNRHNSLDFSVNPEQNNIYRLVFFPEHSGNFDGNITITSNNINEPEISVSVTGSGYYPEPQNVQITFEDENVVITWDEVAGATLFRVYSSNDPYSGFTIDETGTFHYTNLKWTAPIPDGTRSSLNKFYYIVADDDILRK